MNQKIDSVNEIVKFLNKQTIENLAIALMQLERRDGCYPIKIEDYNKFKNVYELYLSDSKYSDLTGLLNEVLQNADEIYHDVLINKENNFLRKSKI